MDDRAIARWRLRTMRLAGRTYPSAPAAGAGLCAVQAENYAHASWSVAARCDGLGQPEFQELFDAGVVLRTHVLRPTWHFVHADDIRWLVELTAPRVRSSLLQLARTLDVGGATLEATDEAVVEALSGGQHLTREGLAEHLSAVGHDVTGQRLGLALAHAELSALVCSGSMQGNRHTYALLDERAPDARRLDRDEALAEIVLRYFRGHGPATERDLSYWATLTLGDVRAGLEAVADQLGRVEHEGRTYWFTEPPPDTTDVEPRAHLLLVLDEYHNGVQDSRYVLDADGVVPRGRPKNMGMALVDGQMVGNVRRTVRGEALTFEIGLFRPLAYDEVQALHEAAERCRLFMGLKKALVLLPS